MYKTAFRFFKKDLELTTNSKILLEYITKEYPSFVIKNKENTRDSIKLMVYPQDNKKIYKYLKRFFLRIRSIASKEHLMFHGSAIVRNNKAIIFLGPPGSGKTTIALYAGQKACTILSDEICMVNRKKLTVSFFQKGTTRINYKTALFLKENGLPAISRIFGKIKNRRGIIENKEFALSSLEKIGVQFAKKSYPIEKIYLFCSDKNRVLNMLPYFCYGHKYLKPGEGAGDLRSLLVLLGRCPYETTLPLNLDSIAYRKIAYKRISDFIG